MSYPYAAGSQFDDSTHIDPQIILLSREQLASRFNHEQHFHPTSDPSIPNSDRGVGQSSPSSPSGYNWHNSLPNRPATPVNGNAFGSHRLPFQRPAFPATPPSTDNSLRSPQHRRLREIQASSQLRDSTQRLRAAYGPPSRSWQHNNPYAVLDPDAYTTQQDGDDQLTSDDPFVQDGFVHTGNQFGMVQHNGFHPEPNFFKNFNEPLHPGTSPPLPATNNQDASSEGATIISSENLSRLPANPPANEVLGRWNQDTYQIVGRIPPGPAPPSPAPSRRHNRRTSRASTTITMSSQAHIFTCDKCHKSFEKRHKLNHHYRWHEDPTHVCEECGKGFVAKKDVKRHRKIHNKEARHLFCNILGCKYRREGFCRMDHLKRHNERVHPGNPWPLSANPSIAGG